MTNQSAFNFFKEQLILFYPETEAKAMAEIVFEDVFGLSKSAFSNILDKEFNENEKLNKLLKRLKTYEPLQHIIGFTFFKGLKININPDVLIPRPETEELLDWILEDTKETPKIIADICTGSGCIVLALKKHYKLANCIATDVSEKALETAKKNEKQLFNTSEIKFAKHNCLQEEWHFEWPDIVISNPPYIAASESAKMNKNVLAFEPHLALFAPENDVLIFYKSIIQLFFKQKMPVIYFHFNPLTAKDLSLYCEELGLSILLKEDMYGKLRFAKLGHNMG